MNIQVRFTYAAILGLPSEKVQQGCEWLPDQNEADPEDDVTRRLASEPFDLGQGIREDNQWNLAHHSSECDA